MKAILSCGGSIFVMLLILVSRAQRVDLSENAGLYFGQTPPGSTPEIFAPGFVSSEHQEHSSLAISADGREMFWIRWRLPHDNDNYPLRRAR